MLGRTLCDGAERALWCCDLRRCQPAGRYAAERQSGQNGQPLGVVDSVLSGSLLFTSSVNSSHHRRSSPDWQIYVWSLGSGRSLCKLSGHVERIQCAIYSLSGHRIVRPPPAMPHGPRAPQRAPSPPSRPSTPIPSPASPVPCSAAVRV